MKAIAKVVAWERVDKPTWYEGIPVGDKYGPIVQEFWVRKGCEWPLVILTLHEVRPDGGVKPTFSFKLGKNDWFMEPDNAGSGLPPCLARRLGELLIEHAGPEACGLCGHDTHGPGKGCDVVLPNRTRCGCQGAPRC